MRSYKSKREGGFSLVEVTLAIGITAVALVSLMGMLPKGLKTLQKAADQAVMGRIHQQILGEIQLTSWEAEGGGVSPVDSFHGQIRFFDDQGIEIPASDKGQFNHVYTARISMPKPGGRLPGSVGGGNYKGALVPGDESAASDQFVRMALVEITSNVDSNFLSDPGSGFDKILTYPNAVFAYRTMVAKMGRVFE